MAPHLTHVGVHDHGFNNVSTYGGLWRLAREGRIRCAAVGSPFLRARAEGQRRRPGAALDARCPTAATSIRSTARTRCSSTRSARCARWRVAHRSGIACSRNRTRPISLLERLVQHARATARVCRLLRRAAATPTTSAAAPRTRASSTSRTAPTAARAASRVTRRSRPGRAGWRGRCSASPNSSSSSRRPSDDVGGVGESRRDRGLDARGRARDLRLLHRPGRPPPTACRIGIPARPDWSRSATGRTVPPIRSTTTNPWTAPPPRSPHRVCSGSAACWLRGARTAAATSRPACGVLAALLDERGPYLSTGNAAPGTAAALDLSPAERLGLRAGGLAHPARRVEPVGRLPPARGRALVRRLARGEPYLTFFGPATAAPELRRRSRAPLVTGGTRGIGLGIARALAAEGWRLALCGVRPQPDAIRDRARRSSRGRRTTFRPMSAARRTAAASPRPSASATAPSMRWSTTPGRAPRVRADILEASEDSFEELLRINLQGPYFLTQASRARWSRARAGDPAFTGAIVFMTSVSAEMASTKRGEYCVSKAGLAMAARLFAVRLAPDGIPVYEVRPGIIATDMTAAVRDVYDARIADGLVPEGRWGQPADVGRAVAALRPRRHAVCDRLRHSRRRRLGAAQALGAPRCSHCQHCQHCQYLQYGTSRARRTIPSS